MLLVSWNVAGWSSTAHRIHQHYQPKPSGKNNNNINDANSLAVTTTKSIKDTCSSSAAASSSPLLHFLDRHGATILCLQEHKIPRHQLSNRSEPHQVSTLPGYESFWSCGSSSSAVSMNFGVVTYAPTGTVCRANADPLRDTTWEGRCLVTEHGRFVLCNVYAPTRGSTPLAQKLQFHRLLRQTLQRERRCRKKPVVLVGDLNLTHRARDVFWKDRCIHVRDVLEEVAAAAMARPASLQPSASSMPPPTTWKRQLAQHWATIEAVLATKQVMETTTTNSTTNETYQKFRLAVTVNNRRVFLGSHETAADHCLYPYDFAARTYIDEEEDQVLPAREANVVRVGILAELLSKIVGVEWDEALQRQIATEAASEPRVSPLRDWLDTMLQEDDMVDTFRHFYPTAEARYTCWHQLTNRRYVNDGSRLDYIIVDRCLLEDVGRGPDGLRTGGGPPVSSPAETLTEAAALRAATANGRFAPVSFEGGGIVEVPQAVLDTQFGEPHTGMIYTPPSFSDHIAVSVLMKDDVLPTDLSLANDSATRKAQPQKSQPSIASFFAKGSDDGPKRLSATRKPLPPLKRTKMEKKKVNKSSILYHFQSRKNG